MESLLSHPVGGATKRRISNYGIELEVLTGGDRPTRAPMVPQRPRQPVTPDLATYVVADCDCESCREARTRFESAQEEHAAAMEAWRLACDEFDRAEQERLNRPRDANGRFVTAQNSDRPPANLAKTLMFLESLRRADLTNLTAPHSYHCRCEENCAPRRPGPHFTAQNDSSVGIEFISRVLKAGTADAQIVEELISAYERGMRWTGFVPQSNASHGNHIHVSNSGTDDGTSPAFRDNTRKQARLLLDAVMAYGNFGELADGAVGRLRSYNAQPTKDPGATPIVGWESGSWIGDRGYGTMEFRLWNTPREPRRIAAHIGLSIALTRWAFKQVIVNRNGLLMTNNAKLREQLVEHAGSIQEVLVDCVPDEFRADAMPLIRQLEFSRA